MLRTTVFSACPAIFSRYIRPEYLLVVMPRDNICLARDARYPEAVDHVVRLQVHMHHSALRYEKRIGSNYMLVRIVKLPPPLMSDRPHSDLRHAPISARNILQAKHSINGPCQDGEQKERRQNRPDNFDRVIAVNLPGRGRIRAFAVAEN